MGFGGSKFDYINLHRRGCCQKSKMWGEVELFFISLPFITGVGSYVAEAPYTVCCFRVRELRKGSGSKDI